MRCIVPDTERRTKTNSFALGVRRSPGMPGARVVTTAGVTASMSTAAATAPCADTLSLDPRRPHLNKIYCSSNYQTERNTMKVDVTITYVYKADVDTDDIDEAQSMIENWIGLGEFPGNEEELDSCTVDVMKSEVK